MTGRNSRALTLGVYPTARGFGWAAFENPFTVYQHGVYSPRRHKNALCLRKLEWLIDRLQPEELVLEAFDSQSSIRSTRIRRLCQSLVPLAASRTIDVAIYKRSQVQATFRDVGARTRYEIAEAVARHVSALAPHLPAPRKIWTGEHRRLSVFNAAALVLTHYQNGAAAFLQELKDAA